MIAASLKWHPDFSLFQSIASDKANNIVLINSDLKKGYTDENCFIKYQ